MGHPIAGVFLAGIGIGFLAAGWAVPGKEDRSALWFGGVVMEIMAVLMTLGAP